LSACEAVGRFVCALAEPTVSAAVSARPMATAWVMDLRRRFIVNMPLIVVRSGDVHCRKARAITADKPLCGYDHFP